MLPLTLAAALWPAAARATITDEAPPIIASDYGYQGCTCGNCYYGERHPTEGQAIDDILRNTDPSSTGCPSSRVVSMDEWWPMPPATNRSCGLPLPRSSLGIEGWSSVSAVTNLRPVRVEKWLKNPPPDDSCVSYINERYIYRGRATICPPGYPARWDDTVGHYRCLRTSGFVDPPKNCGDGGGGCDDSGKNNTGNPVNTGTGNKYQVETDYTGAGPFALSLARYYNSIRASGHYQERGVFGTAWRSSYWSPAVVSIETMNLLTGDTDRTYATVHRPDGRSFYFRFDGTTWVPDPDVEDRLARTASGWTYTLRDGTVETYDHVDRGDQTGVGKLLSIRNPAGLTQTLVYYASGPDLGRLHTVTGPHGHTLSFGYDTAGRLATLTAPDGKVIGYGYDASNNLTRVDYPDGTAKLYHYEKAGFPNHLTGTSFVDSAGTVTRYATYDYDTLGRATVTQHADVGFGGPQEKLSLVYDSVAQTTVTDAAGTAEVLTFTTNLGVKNLTKKLNKSDNKYLEQRFDANNNLLCRKDPENRVTLWSYNTTNQKVSETVGLKGTSCATCVTTPSSCTTPETHTTTYQYLSPTLDVPTVIESPSVASGQVKRVTLTYDDPRFPTLPTGMTQSGYTPSGTSVSRSIGLTYTSTGQVATLDGPRSDVSDITTLDYYACTTGGSCGQLKSVTNALGQVWRYDYYDAAGRVIQVTDPDGLTHTYSYDARGRVASATDFRAVPWSVRGVSYTYTPAGKVKTASFFPENLILTYGYDAALNLRSITDSVGNRVTYTYDTRGNRTGEYTNDPDGALSTFISRAHDRRNALEMVSRWRTFSAPAAITGYVNDATGHVIEERDPNQTASSVPKPAVHSYDALSRLIETLDALTGRTAYGYDVADRLTRVTAPNQATTTYAYDDLGNLLTETSPDRGTTSYTYDAAGNVKTVTDARSITVSYSYDALNRVTGVDYPGTEEDVTYAYDSGTGCTRGVGRLCRVTDEAGTEDYAYDAFGNLQTTTRTVFDRPYTTQTGRDARGRLTSLTYPDGRTATYTRDALGRITRITATVNGTTQTLVEGLSYRADHRFKTRTFGNGLTETRVHGLDGTLKEQYLGSADTRLYGYDLNGNLTTLQSLPRVADFGYDALDRLTADPDPDTFTYDPNGNRKTETRDTATTAYTYPAAGNRLTGVGGTTYSYDPAGNLTGAGGRGYTYAGSGRLRMGLVNGALTGYYRYAHTGLRLQKFSWATGWRVHQYAADGKLLQETADTGTLVRAYVWDDDSPVAQIDRDPTTGQETLTYLHTDYLGTPRLGTNGQQAVVWGWEGNAFGETQPSGAITVNLRFPGQYYDAETGLHYNWHRYYDPKLGRYITSDPIGLAGGINTFAYVENNPLRYMDPTGLTGIVVPIPVLPPPGTPVNGGQTGATWEQLGKELAELARLGLICISTATVPVVTRSLIDNSQSAPLTLVPNCGGGGGGGGSCSGDDCEFTGLAGVTLSGQYGMTIQCQYRCPKKGVRTFTRTIPFRSENPAFLCPRSRPENTF